MKNIYILTSNDDISLVKVDNIEDLTKTILPYGNEIKNNMESNVDFEEHENKDFNYMSISSYAKCLTEIGFKFSRNSLFKWFRDNGYIIKQENQNLPKQVYINQGLFKVRQIAINTSDGIKISLTPYVTLKGKKYFLKKIMEDMGYGDF